MNLPTLLTLHVRSNYLETQLNVLINAGIETLFISIDGARNLEEKKAQAEMLEIIDKKRADFSKIQINLRTVNNGLACGMISGIDWFFSKVEFGAIFEDDVIFTSDTLDFFQEAKELLTKNSEILMIGGSQPFSHKNNFLGEVVLTNYPQIWGWTTTSGKWRELRSFITNEPEWNQIKPTYLRNFWKVGWKRVEQGYVDTWDLPIAGGMLASRKLCALPPINLTSNLGFDDKSTNTIHKQFPLGLQIEEKWAKPHVVISFDNKEIQSVNKKFERQVFKVSYRHLFSPLIQKFDFCRFRNRTRIPIKERINL